jgi:hypothetical protein
VFRSENEWGSGGRRFKRPVIKKKHDELMEQKELTEKRLAEAERKLEAIPDVNVLNLQEKRLKKIWKKYEKKLRGPVSFKKKREILEACLQGTGYPREKGGVYVTGRMKNPKRAELVGYEIVGALRKGTPLLDAMNKLIALDGT